ncbi:MAG: efflux RND transporter periplasmic adaptor subunit [Acidobacteriota bacterium]
MTTTITLCPGRVAVLALLCVLPAAAGCGRADAPPVRAAGFEAPAPPTIAEPDEHLAESEASDLDRPVEDLVAQVCEHEIPAFTCDECRYEVGVARADARMFDAGAGGVLATMRAGFRPLAGGKGSTGEIRLNQERAVYLSPLAPGVVRSISVDAGATVRSGQVLFEVDSAEYRQAKADLMRSASSLALNEATAERERDLFAKGVCPKKDVLEAEAALGQARAERAAAVGRLLSYGLDDEEVGALEKSDAPPRSDLLAVRAPFAGTILERSLSLGEQARPGDRLLLLADTSTIWVIATVHEREVAAVLQAQRQGPVRAAVTVSAYPDAVYEGRVEQVSGTLEEATRTASVRVVVENPGNLLRAGMFARVELLMPGAPGGVALPRQAVLGDAGRSFVFVRLQGPYFIRRPVITGRAFDDWVEVAGIDPGAEVVIGGAFLLKSDVLRSKMGAGCAD